VADQDDVAQVLEVQHRGDVLDVTVQIHLGVQQVGPLAQAGKGRHVDVVSMGPTLDPHAAFLIQRGMRTYFLRYERQCANALASSQFLKSHPRVKIVHYPGLDGHPQHLLARRQMSDFGAVVTIELDGGFEQGARFAEALQLFSMSASVGSAESLVMPPQLLAGHEYTPEQRAASLITRGTVRLSIGLEDAADLVQDLHQALDRAFS
jgi:cystathionine beta-lyase/cystathionine gamma-synthase